MINFLIKLFNFIFKPNTSASILLKNKIKKIIWSINYRINILQQEERIIQETKINNYNKLSDFDIKEIFTNYYRLNLKHFLENDNNIIKFNSTGIPKVSIILILHNRSELTLQCLRTISENFKSDYEIIIFDNNSKDETRELLKKISGANITYNTSNLHFLKSCNSASKKANGKYLLFLNNDAQLFPGAIESALSVIQSSSDIGAVGAKIILLDGKLQEAGNIIWSDGSCLGFGRGDNPSLSNYSFIRDVHYCSGAFLLTPRELFNDLNGFDEIFEPAYYEETDYCLRLWDIGKRVVYNPNSVILHYEFASSSSNGSAIELQLKNQKKFFKKHQEKLKFFYPPSLDNTLNASFFGTPMRKILFLDDRFPNPSLGAGFPRANEILKTLLNNNFFVSFYPLNYPDERPEKNNKSLNERIELIFGYGRIELKNFLIERKYFYDYIFISRPHNMEFFNMIFENPKEIFTNSKIIYDAEAMVSLRELAKMKLIGDKMFQKKFNNLLTKELELTKFTDKVVAVSSNEGIIFQNHGIKNVEILGNYVALKPTPLKFSERSGILFVGALHDLSSPNADSLNWFLKEIFPSIIVKLGPDIKLTVAGFNGIGKIKFLNHDNVNFVGEVDDLTPYYDSHRVFIAPTRFAAGIPLKIHHAAAHGLPSVTTILIKNQLNWNDGIDLMSADHPHDFANKCIELYQNEIIWDLIRKNALLRIKSECSNELFEEQITQIFN